MLFEDDGVVDVCRDDETDESSGIVEFHDVFDLLLAWVWMYEYGFLEFIKSHVFEMHTESVAYAFQIFWDIEHYYAPFAIPVCGFFDHHVIKVVTEGHLLSLF